MRRQPTLLPLALACVLAAPAAARDDVPKPEAGKGLRKERERLASYRWRLKTEMNVDGLLRLLKVEDVHLGPDGGLVKKTVRYDKKAPPTPLPWGDPRAALPAPASAEEDDRLFDQAQELMQLYARLTPEQVDAWAAGAAVGPASPEHPGQLRMEGRGLGRPEDDVVVYLDTKRRIPTEIEVKTTVDKKVVDIAFLRASFEPLPAARPGLEPLVVPKRIFLNMNRGKRRVTLEMEMSDYRSWP